MLPSAFHNRDIRRAQSSGPWYEGRRYDLYVRSSGPVLRYIGRAIYGACDLVVAEHLTKLLARKIEGYGARENGRYLGEL